MYGQTARSLELARAVVGVAKMFGIAFMGLAGTCHQRAAQEMDVKFIAGQSYILITSPRLLIPGTLLQNGLRI